MAIGTKVEIHGESEYRRALKDITSSLRLVSSEMKLTTTQFSSGDKTVRQTKTSYDNMSKSLQEQREKVGTLREALEKAEKEYGSNNEKVKMFKTQLNNAENQLKQMETATDKSTKELKEMKQGFDDAGDGATRFGDVLKANVLGDAIVGGVKALGSAMKQLGTTFVNIGKQALGSYAEYEQLVGGVESMYGGMEKGATQINKVMELSKTAWKDLTMSQNDYITSFTSTYPLMKNDIEDQNEAIEKTNRIMTLNSDLANTFGYSMESASNAVNWALKGTFSYLDNLNIGIKGTKEGFLEAAHNVGYMVDSVDELTSSEILDILEKSADKFGVLGKTADEAKKTIQGSTNMMKSSWQNMLTGITDDSADFGGLVNNLVDSIVIAGENIIPRIETIITGVVDLVMALASKLVDHMPQILQTGMQLLQTLINGIMTMLPQLLPVVLEIVNSLVKFLTDNLPTILELGITVLFEFMKGIADALPELVPQIVNVIIKIMEVFNENFNTFLMLGIKVILGLIKGIINSIPDILKNLPTIIMAIVNFFTLSKFLSLGKTVISGLVSGLKNSTGSILSEIPKLVGKMISSFKSGGWSGLGKDIIRGICNGFTSMGNFIWSAVKRVGNSMLDGIKSFFGIKSPSKLMEDEVGTYLAEGIGVGFEDTMNNVSKDMANAIPTEFDTSINASIGSSSSSVGGYNYGMIMGIFKEALKDVKIVMNDREFGTFVTDTMEKVVYS